MRKPISEAKRAQELDPLSGYINTLTGVTFIFAGQLDRAIEEFQIESDNKSEILYDSL